MCDMDGGGTSGRSRPPTAGPLRRPTTPRVRPTSGRPQHGHKNKKGKHKGGSKGKGSPDPREVNNALQQVVMTNKTLPGDGGGGERRDLPPRPRTPWDEFKDHLRQIDDHSAMLAPKVRAPKQSERDGSEGAGGGGGGGQDNEEDDLQFPVLDLRSSDVFTRVMHEVKVKKENEMRRKHQELLARRARLLADNITEEELQKQQVNSDDDDNDDEEYGSDDEMDQDSMNALVRRKRVAERAWALIRRNVREAAMERKNRGTTMNWNFLHQTMAAMTDMERARKDLYERYITKPNTWVYKNFTNVPKALLDRTLIGGNVSSRPGEAVRPTPRKPPVPRARGSKAKT